MNDISYIAGAIDGDGSFSLCQKKDPNGLNTLYYPLIQLASTDYRLPYLLRDNFGGAIHIRKAHIGNDGNQRKTSYQWKIEKRTKCYPFLQEIVPFLIVKKEQAQTLIDYLDENPFIRGSRGLEQHVIERRMKTYLKMQQLNSMPHPASFMIPKKRKNSEDCNFWKYVAGLMDTDGSFSIKRQKTKRYAPVILLTMKEPAAINYFFKQCIYGSICTVTSKTTRHGHSFRFGIFSVLDCHAFLEKILPYVYIKKDQAEILHEYCTIRLNADKKLSSDEHEYWYQRMIKMNGVVKSPLIDLEPVTDNADGNKGQAGNPCSLNAVSVETVF